MLGGQLTIAPPKIAKKRVAKQQVLGVLFQFVSEVLWTEKISSSNILNGLEP
ncbi:hypothetical protein LPAF129_18510 [Ligilactobacillus pabuli]|uniref:Transposase n=1 Tax=Ligilactobacillus pabuli TaxID=2886039 RepID=A0ABQ5JMR4_9LACO|nr:hypothetical protein LPAF129_18510 [Ligilactobacillus pabuli]